MSSNTMIIPTELKVGFNDRTDCYSGKLGYVIYKDNKNVWRKEKSWESWRKKEIDTLFIKNDPLDGFVLNKKVGGAKESWGWNTRLEKVRVFDPRGFEIEITVPNLLYILRETDCSRGKGLEGKFVYAWSGTELVLVPTNAQEYVESTKHTSLQNTNIKAKELVVGYTYLTKKSENLIYLGRFDTYCESFETYHYLERYEEDNNDEKPKKMYVFYSVQNRVDNYRRSISNYVFLSDVKKLAQVSSDVVDENLAEYLEKFGKINHKFEIVEIKAVELELPYKENSQFAIPVKNSPRQFDMMSIGWYGKDQAERGCTIWLENGKIKRNQPKSYGRIKIDEQQPRFKVLAKDHSGRMYKVNDYILTQEE